MYFNIARCLLLCRPSRKRTFRFYSSSGKSKNDLDKIRTFGILAHIDAGKTTTTERMLFYSGTIKSMGEVHHGNTVTDYMDQERERGITIRSAAVTFNWKSHQFNLVDTPGHIDFTMEVEDTMSVLDGAIVILDGSAGVEAQTLTVWRQAELYKIPRIVFVNKMDRRDASLVMSCKSIQDKLDKLPLCLQKPLIIDSKFVGVIDLLTLEKYIYSADTKNILTKSPLSEIVDGALWEEAKLERTKLIDTVSGLDDTLANIIISSESLEDVRTVDVVKALRNVTLEQKVIPVLCGSAYKNIGVQPLMDSAILYLPSPAERNQHFQAFESSLCGRAFKVVHDKQRGPLVFCRLYSGSLKKGQKIYNVSRDQNETVVKLYNAYADEYHETEAIDNGSIAIVSGMRHTCSGDLISQSASAADRARKKMSENGDLTESEIEGLFERGAKVPEPVFFCSIEPPSVAFESKLEAALSELQREDPSLRVTHDEETGQTVLAGMGELHLEIIKDRILKEYRIDADLGPLQIAYREAPIAKVSTETKIENTIGNTRHSFTISLTLEPSTNASTEVLKLDKTHDAASNLAHVRPKHMNAIKQGILVGVSRGPKIHSQVVNVQVTLHRLEVARGTVETVIAAGVTQCVQKMLSESGTYILEPIMSLDVVTPEQYLSPVLSDLGGRRADIGGVNVRDKSKVVVCETPLSELMGYSTFLRTLTSGTSSFTMEFSEYRRMSAEEESKAIASVRGF